MQEILARRRVPLGFVATAVALVLAHPTWQTWRFGVLVAFAGEAFRIWAAGHLEKGSEVTRSGPYRWTRHPLYAGSLAIAAGVAIASHSVAVALVAAVYMGATITAAIRSEEAHLRQQFGDMYDSYSESRAEPMERRFSWGRVVRNREYRSLAGLLIGFAILALKVIGSL